jgi:hypothetical protein
MNTEAVCSTVCCNLHWVLFVQTKEIKPQPLKLHQNKWEKLIWFIKLTEYML